MYYSRCDRIEPIVWWHQAVLFPICYWLVFCNILRRQYACFWLQPWQRNELNRRCRQDGKLLCQQGHSSSLSCPNIPLSSLLDAQKVLCITVCLVYVSPSMESIDSEGDKKSINKMIAVMAKPTTVTMCRNINATSTTSVISPHHTHQPLKWFSSHYTSFTERKLFQRPLPNKIVSLIFRFLTHMPSTILKWHTFADVIDKSHAVTVIKTNMLPGWWTRVAWLSTTILTLKTHPFTASASK